MCTRVVVTRVGDVINLWQYVLTLLDPMEEPQLKSWQVVCGGLYSPEGHFQTLGQRGSEFISLC